MRGLPEGWEQGLRAEEEGSSPLRTPEAASSGCYTHGPELRPLSTGPWGATDSAPGGGGLAGDGTTFWIPLQAILGWT